MPIAQGELSCPIQIERIDQRQRAAKRRSSRHLACLVRRPPTRLKNVIGGGFSSYYSQNDEGEIEFDTDPDDPGELLLDFDPRGELIEIEQGGTVFLSRTFPGI